MKYQGTGIYLIAGLIILNSALIFGDLVYDKISGVIEDSLNGNIKGPEEILAALPRETEILLPHVRLLLDGQVNPLSQVIYILLQ